MSENKKELQRVCRNISRSTKNLENDLIDFLVVFKKLLENEEVDAQKVVMESEMRFRDS